MAGRFFLGSLFEPESSGGLAAPREVAGRLFIGLLRRKIHAQPAGMET
jgi:hypothetical protein